MLLSYKNGTIAIGLNDARRALIKALEDGDFQHDPRDALSEKNLLAIGEVTETDVIHVLRRTRGDQYSSSPHDWDRLLNQSAVFVSIHK